MTALGASDGSHVKIAILGAANTVIAGVLSFFRGQGLPNRLKQFQHTMRVVREYIEQRERNFARLDCNLDVDHEIKAILSMYEDARKNDEANDPDSYHNPLSTSIQSAPSTTASASNMSKSRAGDSPQKERNQDHEARVMQSV